jgi:tyrosyl-tRNA synthetase
MNLDEQVKYLMQGTEYGDETLQFMMAEELRQRLVDASQEGRPLRVYCGYDPRTTDLHLGHTVTMRKLRQFQELGHEVTFLIGNYTSLIGDPSDKDKLRPQLSPEQVAENGETYAEQAFRILDREKTIIRYNAEWLSELTFAQLIKLASNFTLQQFVARDNFKLRWEKGEPVYLHETFYAIMQGYDALMLKADVQLGGTDQLFNIVTAARKVMSVWGAKPNIAIIMGILPGTDGVIKMSKSLGNHIPIASTAEDMYGKIMSVPDSAMPVFHRLVTRWTPSEICILENAVSNGEVHPRDAKMKLAREVVSSLYSEGSAVEAERSFIRLFQLHDLPEEIPEYQLQGEETIINVLVVSGMVSSKSEVRRLISQKGIRLDGEIVRDGDFVLKRECILQAGKRRFLKLTCLS